MKFIQVDAAGVIVGTCETSRLTDDPTARGLVEVPAETDLAAVLFCPYDRATRAIGPKPRPRHVYAGDWLDRFTTAELVALEALAETPTPAGRFVKVFLRRVEILARRGGVVDLDQAAFVSEAGELRDALTAAGVSGWATPSEAAARLAVILG